MEAVIRLFFLSLESGSVYALAALGIIIIFRTSFVTNFAQGTMAMFSAYLAAVLFNRLGWSIGATMIIAIMFSFALGVGVDFFVMQRAKKVGPVGKQIISMGLISLFLGLAPVLLSQEALPYRALISPDLAIAFGSVTITYNLIFNFVLSISIMAGLFFFLQKTKYGLAVRATATNEVVARMMGIPTKYVSTFAWGVASMLGVMSALIVAPLSASVSPLMMNDVQITAFLALVLGGFQTFYGPVIAAYMIAVFMNMIVYFGFILDIQFMQVWGLQILYLLILGFLVIRPYGLFGKKFIKKV
jgi:branched-chain amino acid transport system permease protein